MKIPQKTYSVAFKEKAILLSLGTTNLSKLLRELQITHYQLMQWRDEIIVFGKENFGEQKNQQEDSEASNTLKNMEHLNPYLWNRKLIDRDVDVS